MREKREEREERRLHNYVSFIALAYNKLIKNAQKPIKIWVLLKDY
jgi:hypothetical protein